MRIIGSIKNKKTKDGNGKKLPYVYFTEVLLIHCNIVSNDYQHYSRVLYAFVLNKSFGQLLETSPKSFIFGKALIESFHLLKHVLPDKILNSSR